ncbi:NADPH-dependent 1-acyldihydroxyacetone phosphate reductase [Fusarium oxysporum f. sp. albedinis]|nr:NADPH-dependent 1-acyldihydroxyacetone phosphate reductase [Fusarium oxysporum f. sp. albedinis]
MDNEPLSDTTESQRLSSLSGQSITIQGKCPSIKERSPLTLRSWASPGGVQGIFDFTRLPCGAGELKAET